MKKQYLFGKKFKDGVQIGDKNYLSYSAAILWEKDKEKYRELYYKDAPRFDNDYTRFGKLVHKQIEDGELELKDHPHRDHIHELSIFTVIEGVNVLGYLDVVSNDKKTVTDVKTGMSKWTTSKTQKLLQLPWYQLLLHNEFGKVSSYAKVAWLETEWHEKKEGVAKIKQLRLTGKQEIFTRRSYKNERGDIREMIKRVAEEITEDYKHYQ